MRRALLMPAAAGKVERRRWFRAVAGLCGMVLAGMAAAADLIGHGGPVRAMALSQDGTLAATGSFDSTVILWSLADGRARQVLRYHQGVVHAVALLGDGRVASAGEDGRIALWRPGSPQPEAVLTGHGGPVVALAVAPDGQTLASASWDGTARLWRGAAGPPLDLAGHRGNVNGVGFLADGRIVTADYDGMVRRFSADGAIERSIALGVPLSTLIVLPGDDIVIAGADGGLRFVSDEGVVRARLAVAEAPMVALAASPDGRRIAAAGFRGALAIIDPKAPAILRRMEGPAFPLWSLGFSQNGEEILTGGADRRVRRWRVATGEALAPIGSELDDDVPDRLKTHPGAEVFRACRACHTLGPDDGNRAGPSLAGLYGRRIGTHPGYDFSPALRQLDIVWSPETLQRLFEIGPNAYTPGTKMPEQIVANVEDRRVLADFLGRIPPR